MYWSVFFSILIRCSEESLLEPRVKSDDHYRCVPGLCALHWILVSTYELVQFRWSENVCGLFLRSAVGSYVHRLCRFSYLLVHNPFLLVFCVRRIISGVYWHGSKAGSIFGGATKNYWYFKVGDGNLFCVTDSYFYFQAPKYKAPLNCGRWCRGGSIWSRLPGSKSELRLNMRVWGSWCIALAYDASCLVAIVVLSFFI